MTRRVDVLGVALLLVALVIGVWLGLAAPNVSPIMSEAPFGQGAGDGNGGRR